MTRLNQKERRQAHENARKTAYALRLALRDAESFAEWTRIKITAPDTIILLRVGDFYETYDRDALLVSKVCGVTLSRPKYPALLEVRHVCGFPYCALDTYLPKLTRANHRCVITEAHRNLKPSTEWAEKEVCNG